MHRYHYFKFKFIKSDPTLADFKDEFTSRVGEVTALIPDINTFVEGASGNNMGDGGNDMFDGGNFLSTD